MTSTTLGMRTGSLTFALAGALFAVFPLVRPWADQTNTADGFTAAMGSPWWVVAHLAGACAFLLLALGSSTMRDLHVGTRGEAPSRAALVLITAGTGLTLLFFGAETFALHAVADGGHSVLETASAIREGTVQLSVFTLGLLLLAVGAVLLAVAVWRGGVLGRTSALLLAALIALYLPQFFLPPAGRVVHGILTAVGALWLAGALWRVHTHSKPTRHS